MLVSEHYLEELRDPGHDLRVCLKLPHLPLVVRVAGEEVRDLKHLLNDFINMALGVNSFELGTDDVSVKHFIDL